MTEPLRLSRHAKHRLGEMGLTMDDVVQVILDSEQSYSSYDDCIVYQRGKVAVVVKPRARIIVTVLWNRRDQWSRVSNSNTTQKEK